MADSSATAKNADSSAAALQDQQQVADFLIRNSSSIQEQLEERVLAAQREAIKHAVITKNSDSSLSEDIDRSRRSQQNTKDELASGSEHSENDDVVKVVRVNSRIKILSREWA